jgi:hypothetical protein
VRIPASRGSCGSRPSHVPKCCSLRPRACGHQAAIIGTPNSFLALPTFVSRCLSAFSPALASRKTEFPDRCTARETYLGLNPLPQGRHYRPRGSLLRQRRVVDLAGGVVHNHQQAVPAVVLEPPVSQPPDLQADRSCENWTGEVTG